MKEYLKPYRIDPSYGGSPYTCTRCGSQFIPLCTAKSGDLQTVSICKTCKTEVGIIFKYGSLEAYKKQISDKQKTAQKARNTPEYRKKIAESVRAVWKDETYRKRISDKVSQTWATKTEEEKRVRSCNIKKGMKCSEALIQEHIAAKKVQLEKELGQELIRFQDARYLYNFSWDTMHKQKRATYKIGNQVYLTKQACEDIHHTMGCTGSSQAEKDIVQWLQSYYKGPIITNDKKLLQGKELDIYLPDEHLAIEYNGSYWHSDRANILKQSIPSKEDRQFAKQRHIEKTLLCEQVGVDLIHIFEDDWADRTDIVKSILLKRLGLVSKVYARNCIVKDLSVTQYKQFLEENHLQGYAAATIKLGLFYKDELVECVGILTTMSTHSTKPELVRLCTKKGIQVLGGFSKLLKHSGQGCIISYVDRGTFRGSGYEAVGFKKDRVNPPTYFYVQVGKSYQRIPRYAFQKSRIKYLYEKGLLSYFNPDETEEINMYKNGFGRIWNCGTVRVLYEN